MQKASTIAPLPPATALSQLKKTPSKHHRGAAPSEEHCRSTLLKQIGRRAPSRRCPSEEHCRSTLLRQNIDRRAPSRRCPQRRALSQHSSAGKHHRGAAPSKALSQRFWFYFGMAKALSQHFCLPTLQISYADDCSPFFGAGRNTIAALLPAHAVPSWQKHYRSASACSCHAGNVQFLFTWSFCSCLAEGQHYRSASPVCMREQHCRSVALRLIREALSQHVSHLCTGRSGSSGQRRSRNLVFPAGP